MPRTGRPPLNITTVQIRLNLRLREGEDDDLIAFFQAIPKRRRVSALKSALRAGGIALPSDDSSDDDDLDEVLDAFLF